MKKLIILVLILVLTTLMTNSTLAKSADGLRFGLKIGQETIANAIDINGGSYIYLNSVIGLNRNISLNLKYSTDIAPNSFSDNLISATSQFIIINNHSSATPESEYQMYWGLSYLKSHQTSYYGIKFCPVSMGRGSDNQNAIVEMFPISYLYNPENSNHVLLFEILSIGFYF